MQPLRNASLLLLFASACTQPEPLPPCALGGELMTYADADGDGYGDDATGMMECELSEGRTYQTGDCDDNNATIYPTATELCNGIDDDCDAAPDDGLPVSVYYEDLDGDGFGNAMQSLEACDLFPGYTRDNTDCDDSNANNYPGNLEVCDGVDNDCDTRIDDDDPDVDPASQESWYTDGDGDGYGGGQAVERCVGPPNSSNDGSDCNDTDPTINPAGQETCSAIDEDCDGLIADDDPSVDPAGFSTWYLDSDGDGFGVASSTTDACNPPVGYATNADDCDDSDPNATLLGDWYLDLDGDGVGDGVSLGLSCNAPYAGTASADAGIDCDDSNALIFPGQTEICGDGIDDDCDGSDLSCGPIGAFWIDDGPVWTSNPPVYNCLEACALVFGGVSTDYQCSTSGVVVDNQAYVSGYADATFCTTPVPEDFKLEDPNNPGYQCGVFGCAYSAYVTDNCLSSRNYCWAN